MNNDEARKSDRQPKTTAEWLLAIADSDPELRAQLIERWAPAESWDCAEGIALAWTRDPTKLGTSDLPRKRREQALPEQARHYLVLAHRSSALTRERITPSRFVTWAEKIGLAFHQDWHEAIAQAGTARQRRLEGDARQWRKQLITRWAPAAYWSPAEGAVLAHDLDPKVAIQYTAGLITNIQVPAPAEHLLELANRAVWAGELDQKGAPVAFMRWARSMKVEFHADWWAAVRDDQDLGSRATKTPPSSPLVPELKTRERETLLKLVIGMAIAGYSWDPKAARSDATRDIGDDLQRLGLGLDLGTIRKWLKAGADLLPGDDT